MGILDKLFKSANKRKIEEIKEELILKTLEETKKRRFEAAGNGARLSNWYTPSQTAYEETSYSIRILRARARDLANNNPWSKRACEVIANHTVGSGIRPTLPKGKASKLWKSWAEKTSCDWDGHFNLYGLQWHIMHTVAKSGEALVIRKYTAKGIRLQVLEGDYLDQGKNFNAMMPNEGYTIDGINFDKNGQRTGYWIYKTNPMLYRGVSVLVDAKDVIHIYDVLRPGQVRGVPFGVSALLRLRDLDEYEDAQIIRQKIAACFTAFIYDSVDAQTAASSNEDTIADKMSPGTIERLPAGKDIKFATPPSADGYEPYVRSLLRAISAGYGITYESLTNDLSNVNFSSGRMGWIEMQKNVQRWQRDIMVNKFCEGVWSWFSEYSELMGLGQLETTSWTPPRRDMIDPAKEVSAAAEAIRCGLKTWPETVREMGYDPETTIEEIKTTNAAFDAAKIKLQIDPRYFPKAKSGMDTTAPPANEA